MFFSVKRKQFTLAFDNSLQVHGPGPDREQIFQCVFRVVQAQIDAFVTVFQQQLAAVFVVAVSDVDKRLTEIRQRKQQLFFHALPVPVRDFVDAAFGIEVIGEKLLFMTEFFGEEGVDEGDVVVYAARFKDFFAA